MANGTPLSTNAFSSCAFSSSARPLIMVYAVSSNINKATAVDDIVAAMKDGTMLTFQVYDASGTGALVINGAALPFAVVC